MVTGATLHIYCPDVSRDATRIDAMIALAKLMHEAIMADPPHTIASSPTHPPTPPSR